MLNFKVQFKSKEYEWESLEWIARMEELYGF